MGIYDEKPEGFIYGADEPKSRSHSSRFESNTAKKSNDQKTEKKQATPQNKKKS